MKAINFEFDGKQLSDFGMVLCRFGSSGVETINDVKITFNTASSLNGAKHSLISTQYEDCLEATFQICKHSCDSDIREITATEHRNLTRWLNRKNFLKFKILDESHIDIYYEVKIDVSRIEIDGRLMGLELTVTTNRPFALKEPRTISIDCSEDKGVYGWEKYKTDPELIKLGYVTSTDKNAYPQGKVDENGNVIEGAHIDGYQYIPVGTVYKASINDTSYEEGYIYPYTEITMIADGDLHIYNALESRYTYVANCVAGEVITMDYPVIKSSVSSHNIQNDFNWNFFRIANTFDNSRNDLIVFTPCMIKIKYSPIVKVGL